MTPTERRFRNATDHYIITSMVNAISVVLTKLLASPTSERFFPMISVNSSDWELSKSAFILKCQLVMAKRIRDNRTLEEGRERKNLPVEAVILSRIYCVLFAMQLINCITSDMERVIYLSFWEYRLLSFLLYRCEVLFEHPELFYDTGIRVAPSLTPVNGSV